eukprot:193993_1
MALVLDTDATELTQDSRRNDYKNGSGWNDCPQYSKIIFLGILIGAVVSGIWSFLVHIDSISVYSNNLDINGIKFFNGIYCVPKPASDTDVPYCNNVAESMSMDVDSNSEWDCSLNTDFANSNVIQAFPRLSFLFYFFVITVLICSYFTIIHDIGLLRKIKNNTFNEIRFWPSAKFVNFPSQNKYYNYHKQVMSTWLCTPSSSICCPFYIFFQIVAAIISLTILGVCGCVDLFYMLLLYPFIQCKCNSKYCCSGMMEISSLWIGISRAFAVVSASIFILTGIGGIMNSIDSKDPSSCDCSCAYIVQTSDIIAISAAVGALTATNLLFLSAWYHEVEHGQYYFYLIKYSLPIKFVYALNPNDPTADIMNVDFAQKLTLRIDDNDINHHLNDYRYPNKDTDKTAFHCRYCSMVWSVLYSLFFAGVGIWMGLQSVESRGYSNTVKLTLDIVFWTVFILFGLAFIIWFIRDLRWKINIFEFFANQRLMGSIMVFCAPIIIYRRVS